MRRTQHLRCASPQQAARGHFQTDGLSRNSAFEQTTTHDVLHSHSRRETCRAHQARPRHKRSLAPPPSTSSWSFLGRPFLSEVEMTTLAMDRSGLSSAALCGSGCCTARIHPSGCDWISAREWHFGVVSVDFDPRRRQPPCDGQSSSSSSSSRGTESATGKAQTLDGGARRGSGCTAPFRGR